MTENSTEATPTRVLHIGKYFPPHRGGMETVLRDQMNIQTRDEGLEVAAIVHSSERRFLDKIEIAEGGYRVRHSARWLTVVFTPIAPFFWLSIVLELRKLKPDEIIIHMPNPSAFWLLLFPFTPRRRLSLLWHSDVLPSRHSLGLRSLYWIYKPLERLLLKRAHLIIATSPPYLEFSQPLLEFSEKCVVNPLRLDKHRIPIELRTAPQPKKKQGEGVRVLSVGRLTYYKSFDTVIKAVANIPNAHLRIVGDGELYEDLSKLICTLNLQARVKLLGNVDDETLWQQYVWCDLHCLASCERTEAFGLSVTEAALFKRPSVVSEIEGSGLAWNAMQTGLPYMSVPHSDEAQLAAAIQKLHLRAS